ncbi:ankyrin repeat domain-containing protein [Kitasatospora cinereorecta]|uniref:Ankyrin repeat domain-containing protein n=1 Tax=Kitasatospora cinereorecta TaxID=285560 RepID=A0ABW0VCH7_9ACTN
MTDSALPADDTADRGPELDAELIALAGRLFDAARAGDAAMLTAYLDAGAPTGILNERGDTLVMLAAYHGHAEAVRVLLAHGADPNQLNDRGQTPLAGAVFKGAEDVIDALLTGGADPAAGTPSAVETAEMFGKAELVARFGAR